MQLSKLLRQLRAEHERLGAAIAVLTPLVETPATARKMVKAVRKRSKRRVKAKGTSAKGYKYAAGTHWTQRPENKAKLADMRVKQAAAAKAASGG